MRVWLAVVLVLSIAACGPGQLSRPQAAKLLQEAPRIWEGNGVTFGLNEGKQCVQRENAALGQSGTDYKYLLGLATAGFLTIRRLEARDWSTDRDYFSDQMKCNPVLGQWITVDLTAKGKATPPKKYWFSGIGSAGGHFLTLAERRFVEVTGITTESDHDAKAEFTWQWEPTPVGEPLGFSRAPQCATATFKLYDDGWRLVSSGIVTEGQ
mgnify:CR=1 FL=1